MNDWNVTYDVVTPESAEHGDYADSGFLGQDLAFDDAVSYWEGRGCEIEPSDSDVSQARWFTVIDGVNYRDGSQQQRSLHIPERVSPAARVALFRYLQRSR